jgi:hypothetical protein
MRRQRYVLVVTMEIEHAAEQEWHPPIEHLIDNVRSVLANIKVLNYDEPTQSQRVIGVVIGSAAKS